MLVLSRKPDEIIDITLPDGQVIEIMLVRIQIDKMKARIGVKAPRNCRVDRREVTLAIKEQKCI